MPLNKETTPTKPTCVARCRLFQNIPSRKNYLLRVLDVDLVCLLSLDRFIPFISYYIMTIVLSIP